MCSPGVTYTSAHARRKLLQLPLSFALVVSQQEHIVCIWLKSSLQLTMLYCENF